ncbi:hypothetical protein ABZ353_09385 [Streptomyces niveus]
MPTTMLLCHARSLVDRSYSTVSASCTGLSPAASCRRHDRERDSNP